MGQRRDRLNKRQARGIVTHRKNSLKKMKEQGRRDEQIRQILSKGSMPYTPGVMSWLSEKLDKKAARITAEDVQTLLK